MARKRDTAEGTINSLLGPRNRKKLQEFGQKLQHDQKFRQRFLYDPESVFEEEGIESTISGQFSESDRKLIELFCDPNVIALHAAGDVDGLKDYLSQGHEAVVGAGEGLTTGTAVSDFHVAAEAVAVVVAAAVVAPVAVALGAEPEADSSLDSAAAVATAKIAALDARVRLLERQIARLQG